MDIGIGLPNTIPGVDGKTIAEWARRAEAAGFSTLGTIDRLVYSNLEPLVALSAAAAVTERIRLTTAILLAPLRENAAVLAKQAASLQALSERTPGARHGRRRSRGRLRGRRPADGRAAASASRRCSTRWTRSGAAPRRASPGPIGPDVRDNPPKVIIGGGADAAYRRAAEHAGWIMGGGPPEVFAEGTPKLRGRLERGRSRRQAVRRRARLLRARPERRPERRAEHRRLLRAGSASTRAASWTASAKDAETVQAYVKAFADAGADELILFPSSADPEQVDLLAAAAL